MSSDMPQPVEKPRKKRTVRPVPLVIPMHTWACAFLFMCCAQYVIHNSFIQAPFRHADEQPAGVVKLVISPIDWTLLCATLSVAGMIVYAVIFTTQSLQKGILWLYETVKETSKTILSAALAIGGFLCILALCYLGKPYIMAWVSYAEEQARAQAMQHLEDRFKGMNPFNFTALVSPSQSL